MALVKYLPEFIIRCYTKAKIPKRMRDEFIIADVFSDLVKSGWSDVLDIVAELNPTISTDWAQQPHFVSIDPALEFVRFLKDGTVREGASPKTEKNSGGESEDLAGFILKARDAFVDSLIGETDLEADNFPLHFEAVAGEWGTILPVESPDRTRIRNTGTHQLAIARTKGNVAANRSLRFDVDFTGQINAAPLPAARVIWGGGKYSVSFVHGAAIAVCRYDGAQWKTLRRLPITANCNGGRYHVRVRRLAARLVVTVITNGARQTFHILEPRRDGTNPEKSKGDPAVWPAGPLQFNCWNVVASLGVALIKYASSGDEVYQGSAVRQAVRRSFIPESEEFTAETTGWDGDGTSTSVVPAVVPGGIQYTLTLAASPEGVDTPLVNKVLVRYKSVWNNTVPAYLDIQRATLNGRVSGGVPPSVPMTTASLSVDRYVLDAINTSWRDYVDDDNPIEILVRWQYFNTATGALSYASGGAYSRLFKGYIWRHSKSTAGVNDQKMMITCADPMLRLKGENAKVDYHCPPLDFLFIEKMQAFAGSGSTPTGLKVYGGECIKLIAELFLGPDEAARLNGTGDPLRYMPSGHLPLLSTSEDVFGYYALPGAPAPSSNGFWFPAPFRKDAEGWMKEIGGHDRMWVFYGWPDNNPTVEWQSLVYAREINWLAARPTYEVPDCEYAPADRNRLLMGAETETRPERRINRALVYANPPGGGLGPILPAVRIGEAILPLYNDDGSINENARELGWERTLEITNDVLIWPGLAEGVAQTIINELRGVKLQWPRLSFRGSPEVQWGDKLTPRMNHTQNGTWISDRTLGIHNQTFRSERIEHTFNLTTGGKESFQTHAYVRPISSSGF